MAKILIIDDEEYIRDVLSIRVQKLNHDAAGAPTLEQGRALLQKENFDLVFLDVNLPDGNGLDLLKTLKQIPSGPEVIIMTAVGNQEGAELAVKNGAWDYMNKPLKREDIIFRIYQALDYRRMKQKTVPQSLMKTDTIIGKSPAIKNCLQQMARCALNDSNVLLTGETGTGKEVFAKAIHENCSVTGDHFIVVDCAAMPESLAESVLFGHVKGSFTGADKASEGLILKAHKGTLFLDEIGELPFPLQGKFLRVLQEKKFRPVGSSVEKESDFRLISATNRDLDEMVSRGTFRKDLLHRIRTFSIELPPLRDRKTDIQDLAAGYLQRVCTRHKLNPKVLLPETLALLESYDWPGNVRELIHTLERAVLYEPESPLIFPLFLPDHIRINFLKQDLTSQPSQALAGNMNSLESLLVSSLGNDPIPDLKDFRNGLLEEIERVYLKWILLKNQGDIEKTAQISGLSKNRIYVLIKKYDLKSGSVLPDKNFFVR